MAKVCSVCALPSDLLADVEVKLEGGVTQAAISVWLSEQGYRITSSMLSNHRNKHLKPQTHNQRDHSRPEFPASHVETCMGSSELIRANIQDAIALSQQLQALNQPTNLRVSRVLVEHLANLHRMLTDVAFEGEGGAS